MPGPIRFVSILILLSEQRSTFTELWDSILMENQQSSSEQARRPGMPAMEAPPKVHHKTAVDLRLQEERLGRCINELL
ncbi:hypothetical protein BGX38DRAFT_1208322, partial [Terfezia claveryi]